MIKLEEHDGIIVLRDDLLPGGTKSVLLDDILPKEKQEFVYATPVYGGFQIALAIWCKNNNKQCTLFCAKRKDMHPNTLRAKEEGAVIIEVEHGYLSVVEKRAKDYMAAAFGAFKIEWGSKNDTSIHLVSMRVFDVLHEYSKLGVKNSQGWNRPDVIFITLGSGMLTEGILKGTEYIVRGFEPNDKIEVHAVQVGAEYEGQNERLVLHKYHKTFDKKCDVVPPFPSMPNYDAKGWEYAKKYAFLNEDKKILFWNVL